MSRLTSVNATVAALKRPQNDISGTTSLKEAIFGEATAHKCQIDCANNTFGTSACSVGRARAVSGALPRSYPMKRTSFGAPRAHRCALEHTIGTRCRKVAFRCRCIRLHSFSFPSRRLILLRLYLKRGTFCVQSDTFAKFVDARRPAGKVRRCPTPDFPTVYTGP